MALTFHANGRIEGSGSTTPYVVGSICQSKKFSITAPSSISATRRQGYPSGIKCSITPISTSPKMNFHKDYISANTIAAPSPKFNIINSHKHVLQKLTDMEGTILNQILHKKSSKDLFDKYLDVLDKKKNILKYNYQNEKKD